MPKEEFRALNIGDGVYARLRALARELSLPADASRDQLVSALARGRVIAPTMRVAYDDTRDLEEAVLFIPPGGLKVPPGVGWRAVPPKLPGRTPRYTIRVRAVMCADDDGSHAATISEATLTKLFKAWSDLYFQSGLKFTLSERVVLKNTEINQDFTVPAGANLTSSTEPMTQKEKDVSFDKHNAARSAWAHNYSGELVVFFRYGTKLIWNDTAKAWIVGPASFAFSGPEHEFVAMGQGDPPESTLLAHESGHYFHLGHTHGGLVALTDAEKALYPDWQTNQAHRDAGAKLLRDRMAEGIRKFVDDQGHPLETGLDVMDADGLADTQPDPGPTIFAYQFGEPCSADTITVQVSLASGARPYGVTASRDIIMSYFFRCPGPKRFSDLQIDKIRYVLETPTLTGTVTTGGGSTLPILSRHHLIAPKYKRGQGPVAATPPRRRK